LTALYFLFLIRQFVFLAGNHARNQLLSINELVDFLTGKCVLPFPSDKRFELQNKTSGIPNAEGNWRHSI